MLRKTVPIPEKTVPIPEKTVPMTVFPTLRKKCTRINADKRRKVAVCNRTFLVLPEFGGEKTRLDK